ncbi:mitochondrial thioredoxin [Clavispora lusitaniae]|nr:mitochondrial thioredoxin [Clavispora lusitaniae]
MMLRSTTRATLFKAASLHATKPTMFARFNSTQSLVSEVRDLPQLTSIINSKDKVSVVDFYATWCGPCKAIPPIFETLAQRIPEVQFARVDVDRATDVAAEYGITAMPTILFFQDGLKVDTIVGANVPKLAKLIQDYSGVDVKSR